MNFICEQWINVCCYERRSGNKRVGQIQYIVEENVSV